MSSRRPSSIPRATLAAGMVAAIAVVIWRSGSFPHRQAPHVPASAANSPATNPDSPVPRAGTDDLETDLLAACQSLRTAPGSAAARPLLEELRRALHATPPRQAAAAIQRFLDAKADAATGQEFKLGQGGALDAAPTLRTFLLDQLGQLDPALAAANARGILATMSSPDEWAIALRNLARGDSSEEGRQLAAHKLQAMLNNPAWQQQPTVGFLEAFDVAVHLRGPELIPTLTDLVRMKDNQAVAHAAYLALDRLTINDPSGTLAILQASPDMMKGRELTRANYFARADVGDEAQRTLLENYLLNPTLAADELEKFSALYPNANFMISHNLLTENPTPNHDWLTRRDREALNRVRRWQEDPRFARLRPQLQAIEQRLQQFVLQAQHP